MLSFLCNIRSEMPYLKVHHTHQLKGWFSSHNAYIAILIISLGMRSILLHSSNTFHHSKKSLHDIFFYHLLSVDHYLLPTSCINRYFAFSNVRPSTPFKERNMTEIFPCILLLAADYLKYKVHQIMFDRSQSQRNTSAYSYSMFFRNGVVL